MTRRDAKPYTETWLSVARIGPRDPALVGAELFNAHTAYVAARAAVNGGNGSRQMYNDAADMLGELLTLVCTDKALAPFLADYLHDNDVPYTPDSADAFLDQWEQQRRRRAIAIAPPTMQPPTTTTTTAPTLMQPTTTTAPLPQQAVQPSPREAAPDSNDARIRELYNDGKGMGQRAIARAIDRPKTTVRNRLIAMELLDA